MALSQDKNLDYICRNLLAGGELVVTQFSFIDMHICYHYEEVDISNRFAFKVIPHHIKFLAVAVHLFRSGKLVKIPVGS